MNTFNDSDNPFDQKGLHLSGHATFLKKDEMVPSNYIQSLSKIFKNLFTPLFTIIYLDNDLESFLQAM